MFFFLAIFGLTSEKKTKANHILCFGKQGTTTECADGSFMNIPDLLVEINKYKDDASSSIYIKVYADMPFTDEVVCKASLEFEDGDNAEHSITWKFGHAGMDISKYGDISFGGDNAVIIPMATPGENRLTLYGKYYSFAKWNFRIPAGITYIVCDIAKIMNYDSDTFYYNSFDEIISPERIDLNLWPTRDIIIVQREKVDSTIASISEKFSIEIQEKQLIMTNAGTFKITIKQSSLNEIPFNFEMDSAGMMNISQTSDTTITKIMVREAFFTTITYKGSKPITNIETLPVFPENSGMKIDIETDMPNLEYEPRDDVTIKVPSVKFGSIKISKEMTIKNPATTIKANYMEIEEGFTATNDVVFNIEIILTLNFKDKSKPKTIGCRIIVNNYINIDNIPELTIKNLEISDSCTIIRRYQETGDLTFKKINAPTLKASKSQNLYFYTSQDNLEGFADELQKSSIDEIHDVLCSDSLEGSSPKINYNIYSLIPGLPDVFSEQNSIIDAKYNAASKCIGIKFTKKVIPLIKVNIGATGQNTETEFFVNSLNSADWNIQNTDNLKYLEIILKKEVAGQLNLNSMNFKSIELTIKPDGYNKIGLDLSQNVANKIKSVSFDSAIEITSSSAFSWKCENMDLTAVTISDAAMNNMKFNDVNEVTILENQLTALAPILNQPRLVNLDISYNSIKFYNSEIEMNGVKKSFSTKNIMLSFTNAITITNPETTNVDNVLLQTNGINNIIIGSDWTNSPNSHPIAVGLKDVYVDTSLSKVVPISLISFDNSVLNILSTNDKQVNLKHKINILRSFNPDRTSFNLDIRKRISAQNKIEEVIFSDDIIADRSVVLKSDLVAKVKTIQTKPTYFADVAEKLALLKKDPTFPTKSDLEIRKQLFEESAIYGNSMEIEKFVANCFIKIDSDDHLQKINNVEMTVAADTIPPYIEIDTVHANEIQFSFVQVDTVKNRGDLDKMFFGKDIVVGNVKNKKCSDLKGFNVAGEASANDGKITLSVSCKDEGTATLIYARLGEKDSEKQDSKSKLTGGQIAGVSIGVILAIVIIVVVVLFFIGKLSCNFNRDTSEGNQRGLETV